MFDFKVNYPFYPSKKECCFCKIHDFENLILKIDKVLFNLKNQTEMKTLKITLFVALLFTAFTSCTKQDLDEDEVLKSPETEVSYYDGGYDDKV